MLQTQFFYGNHGTNGNYFMRHVCAGECCFFFSRCTAQTYTGYKLENTTENSMKIYTIKYAYNIQTYLWFGNSIELKCERFIVSFICLPSSFLVALENSQKKNELKTFKTLSWPSFLFVEFLIFPTFHYYL